MVKLFSVQSNFMSGQLSDGARSILARMRQYSFVVKGDPAKDTPWRYMPTEAGKRIIETIEMPPAEYCRELIRHGLIRLQSGSPDVKSGVYTMSEDGQKIAEQISNT
jgi:hypothetical protein